MLTLTEADTDQNQELAAESRSPVWVAGIWGLEPSPTVSQEVRQQEARIGNTGRARTQVSSVGCGHPKQRPNRHARCPPICILVGGLALFLASVSAEIIGSEGRCDATGDDTRFIHS